MMSAALTKTMIVFLNIQSMLVFMVSHYIDEMKIYPRPMKDYEDFESIIERLLIKGPVVVMYDLLTSFSLCLLLSID